MKKSTKLFLASLSALLAAAGTYWFISQNPGVLPPQAPQVLEAPPALSPEQEALCQKILGQIGDTPACDEKWSLFQSHFLLCQSVPDKTTPEDYSPRKGEDSEFMDRIFAISKCFERAGQKEKAQSVFHEIQMPEDYFFITGGSGCPIDKYLPGYLAAMDFPETACLSAAEARDVVLKILNEHQAPLWSHLLRRGQVVHFGTAEDSHLPCTGSPPELETAWRALSQSPGWSITSERPSDPESTAPPSLTLDLASNHRQFIQLQLRQQKETSCWALASLSVPGTTQSRVPDQKEEIKNPGALPRQEGIFDPTAPDMAPLDPEPGAK